MFFAISLIVIGVSILLDNLGILRGFGWENIWPVLLIAWGVSILLSPRSKYGYWCCAPYFRDRDAETKAAD